jgi:integrase
MSVEAVTRKGGRRWRVRWRDADGRARSKVIGRKADADHFDADITRRKRLGHLALVDQGNQTLGEFVGVWWRDYARPNLAPGTLRTYSCLWDAHVAPRLCHYRLRDLTPQTIDAFRAQLHSAGVGDAAIRKSMVILQGVLQRAVEWEWLSRNPVAGVRKPSGRRKRQIEPLPPQVVERIRHHLLENAGLADAVLVSLLAYAGLRPGEALALRWKHLRERTLLVQDAVADGEIKTTKTGRTRSVVLLEPLRRDLEAHRASALDKRPDALLFTDANYQPWSDHRWRNWRKRVFSPAAAEAGVAGARPYDLRHSFVSLLIHEGRNVVEVATQAGHAPTLCLSTYAHLFAEGAGPRSGSAASAIETARYGSRGHSA